MRSCCLREIAEHANSSIFKKGRRKTRDFRRNIELIPALYESSAKPVSVYWNFFREAEESMEEMGSSLKSIGEVVAEITRIHGSLPDRPGKSEIEAAEALVENVEKEEQLKLDEISRQRKSPEIPEELFSGLQEVQKKLVSFQSKEKEREALKLLHLENVIATFDELVLRASKCLPTTASSSHTGLESSATSFGYSEKDNSELFTKDDSYVKPAKAAFSHRGRNGEKLSSLKLARLIEDSSMKGTRELNLQKKLMDQVEWLPESIGKLSSLITLNCSENRIASLPPTIGGLSSLMKLDLHSNKIPELPKSIGDLLCMVYLDLGGNQLTSLPSTLGQLAHLEELNLRANDLSFLPESIGTFTSLKKLNVEGNHIEEIPYTIGQCSSLVELHADHNHLKALPEAVGRIESLEILSVRYNNIKQLPTTMASLSNLKELDVSFNQLESVPETLCFATTLVKLNIGNNFANLQSLPRSIGNFERLEELDISNNQIRVFPDSFRLLSRLHVLRAEENPLEEPPRHIAARGAEVVVEYMAVLVAKKGVRSQSVRQKTWDHLFTCFRCREFDENCDLSPANPPDLGGDFSCRELD
ncbi:hypothetical protein HHK36_008830 [Tetracentron sinense]|uniref:Disease resistance R13L4/SHOC-2-like LRR domain-containing protein n=1 Tax=Tetracentron sinense TaxID=13715 RepID=A0A835DKB9_TETSI|nr:hypothetical protein HHK36_008830 [Tetracentron sinense]